MGSSFSPGGWWRWNGREWLSNPLERSRPYVAYLLLALWSGVVVAGAIFVMVLIGGLTPEAAGEGAGIAFLLVASSVGGSLAVCRPGWIYPFWVRATSYASVDLNDPYWRAALRRTLGSHVRSVSERPDGMRIWTRARGYSFGEVVRLRWVSVPGEPQRVLISSRSVVAFNVVNRGINSDNVGHVVDAFDRAAASESGVGVLRASMPAPGASATFRPGSLIDRTARWSLEHPWLAALPGSAVLFFVAAFDGLLLATASSIVYFVVLGWGLHRGPVRRFLERHLAEHESRIGPTSET